MKSDEPNIVTALSNLFGHLAAEKKKALIAACLIMVMAVMWARVLTKNQTPASAEAVSPPQTAEPAQKLRKQSKTFYVELPVIHGRNDKLVRNFFDVGRWKGFKRADDGAGSYETGEVDVAIRQGDPNDLSSGTIIQLAQSLRLDAIELGKRPQAFINDTLVSIGQKLQLEDKGKIYEFTVVEISDHEVVVTCEGVRIAIALLQPDEPAN